MDFDPKTGKLWDTENGPAFGDEINLIEPGFNGGWQVVQGMGSMAPAYKGADFDLTTMFLQLFLIILHFLIRFFQWTDLTMDQMP